MTKPATRRVIRQTKARTTVLRGPLGIRIISGGRNLISTGHSGQNKKKPFSPLELPSDGLDISNATIQELNLASRKLFSMSMVFLQNIWLVNCQMVHGLASVVAQKI